MDIDNTETFVLKKKRGFFDMNYREKLVFLTQILGVFVVVVIILFALGLAPKQWSLTKEDVVISPEPIIK